MCNFCTEIVLYSLPCENSLNRGPYRQYSVSRHQDDPISAHRSILSIQEIPLDDSCADVSLAANHSIPVPSSPEMPHANTNGDTGDDDHSLPVPSTSGLTSNVVSNPAETPKSIPSTATPRTLLCKAVCAQLKR